MLIAVIDFIEILSFLIFFKAVIRAVINVLINEEQALGLQQPAGIGQRPRPMSKFYNQGCFLSVI